MRNLLLIMFSTVFLVSCFEFEGNLTLDQEISLKDKRGRTRNVPAGTYRAEIEPKRGDKFHLEMDVEGKERNFPFALPEDYQIPPNGEFNLPSSVSGQDYDLTVTTTTVVEDSESHRDIERCSYDTYVRRCYQGRSRCSCESVRYNDGDRQVEYFIRDTKRDIEALMSLPGEENALGKFQGSANEHEKIYTLEGYCRERRFPEC